MGPKLSAWCVIGPKLAAWGVTVHSSVMRVMCDLLFSRRLSRDFLLKFLWWLISFETRSRDIKIDRYDTKFLPFFRVPQTSDFLRSNDNRILVNVVNILFYLSVMRDSLNKISISAWCVIGPPSPPSPLPPWSISHKFLLLSILIFIATYLVVGN